MPTVAPRLGIVRESLAPLRMESLPESMRAVFADYVIDEGRNNIFVTHPLRPCEEGYYFDGTPNASAHETDDGSL